MNINIPAINPYHDVTWRREFPMVYSDLANSASHVIYTYQEMNVLRAVLGDVYEMPYPLFDSHGIVNAVPYYYLQWILETNPNVVLDVGCGTNPFGRLMPNIVPLDDRSCPPPHDPRALECHFDEDFAASHQEMCDALISVNAIHFSPIWTVTARLRSLASMVRSGGRAYVAFNAETWIASTPTLELQQYFGTYPDPDNLVEYIYQSVLDADLELLVSDWPVCDITENSGVRDDFNGNIRLVIEK